MITHRVPEYFDFIAARIVYALSVLHAPNGKEAIDLITNAVTSFLCEFCGPKRILCCSKDPSTDDNDGNDAAAASDDVSSNPQLAKGFSSGLTFLAKF